MTPDVSDALASQSIRDTYLINRWDIGSLSQWDRTSTYATCASTWGDTNCALRRLLNSAILAAQVMKQSPQSYGGWSESWIGDLDLCNNCSKYADSNTFGYVNIMRSGVFDTTLLRRTATLMHEARHIETGEYHCGDTGENWCTCPSGNCDTSFSANEANAMTVKFIENALNTPSLGIPYAVRAEAIEEANIVLNEGFHTHPGFILEQPGISNATFARRPWTVTGTGDIEIGYMPTNYSDDQTANEIGAINLTSSLSTNRISTGFHSLGLSAIQIHNPSYPSDPDRLVVSGFFSCRTLLGFAQARNSFFAREANDGCPNELLPEWPFDNWERAKFDDASLSQFNPRVITAVRVSASGSAVTALELHLQTLSDGIATGAETVLKDPANLPVNTVFDKEIFAPTGQFISSIGFGTGEVGQPQKIDAIAATFALAPEFEQIAGGTGGTLRVLKCPSGKVPMGITAKKVHVVQYGSDTVGYFGILCRAFADQLPLTAPTSAPETIVRGQFVDETGATFAAGEWLVSDTSHQPTGATFARCPVGQTLSGLVARSGLEVDFISGIECGGDGTKSGVSVNVGGTGGVLVTTQDCKAAPGVEMPLEKEAYASVFYSRSGARLDAVAVGCQGRLDFIDNFGEIGPHIIGESSAFHNPPNTNSVLTGTTRWDWEFDGSYAVAQEKSGFLTTGSHTAIEMLVDSRRLLHSTLKLTYSWYISNSTSTDGKGFALFLESPSTSSLVQLSTTSGWHTETSTINSFKDCFFRIRFTATRGTNPTYFLLDNVRVYSE